ncbi:hypothetical protein V1477_014759 [Vespula maculifrons]|uniref:Uncharacterized protein n=1 Tax=Vespula maculifrons TaxID=7453 RepID=A0ABD2BIE5_VESMC
MNLQLDIYKSKAMFTSGHSIAFSVMNECTQPGIWLAALLGSTASVVDVLGSNIRLTRQLRKYWPVLRSGTHQQVSRWIQTAQHLSS